MQILRGLFGIACVTVLGAALVWLFLMKHVVTDNGHHTVFVDQPYFFGDKGVRDEPSEPGRTLVWRSTSAISVPMTPVTHQVSFNDLPAKDEYLLDFNTSFTYQVNDSVKLIKEFGHNWLANNLIRPYEASFRDVTKGYTMNEIMFRASVAKSMEDELLQKLNGYAKEAGLPVTVIDFNMGQGRPNADVIKEMDNTKVEEQAQKTMGARELKEIQRKEAETKRAEADLAYSEGMGLSSDHFVQLQYIERMSEACGKATNCVIMSGGQGPTPMTLSLPPIK